MPYFTSENARENAAKGNELRWSQYRERQRQREREAKEREIAENAPRSAEQSTHAPEVPVDPYAAAEVWRVRAQIERMHALLEQAAESADAKDAKAAADALSRLYDVERILSGRPLPGTRKPIPGRIPRVKVEPIADASNADAALPGV